MAALLSIVGGFASGIFFRSLFYFGWPAYAMLAIIFILILFGFIFLAARRAYLFAALFILCAGLGAIRSASAETPLPEAFASDVKHRVSYEGIVVGDPDRREKNQRIPIRVTKGEESTKILAVMPLHIEAAVGDHVRVYGTLSVPEPFETDNGRTFRYDKYLEARGIRFLVNFGSLSVEEKAPWHSLPAALARIKHAFLDGLSIALPEPASALAGGIVIGGKSGLGEKLQDAFINSGLIQIIVLSGYNVMVVAEWAMAIFARLSLGRRMSALAGAGALMLLVGIAGITATAVRAAIMAMIALYARATGRSYAASRALLVAVFLMLLWNPLYLCFDPGFGLSVAATAGIIWLAPIIENRWLARVKRPFWRNAIATTLAAQIAVLPLLLFNTGLLSLVALPANLFVNPLVPLAMGGAAVAGIAGMIFGGWLPVLAKIAGFPALALANYFIFVAEGASALPLSTVTLPAFPFALSLVAYTALALFAFKNRSSATPQFMLAKKAST